MRAAAVSASCAVAMIQPSASTGHTSMSTRETKATSPPTVIDSRPTANGTAEEHARERQVGNQLDRRPEHAQQAHALERRALECGRLAREAVADERGGDRRP